MAAQQVALMRMRGILIGLLVLLGLMQEVTAATFTKRPYLQSTGAGDLTLVWQSDVDACSVNIEDFFTVSEGKGGIHKVSYAGRPGSRITYFVNCRGHIAAGRARVIPQSDHFTFIVFGDPRSRPHRHKRVVQRLLEEPAHFIVGTGDFVGRGNKERDWQQFFDIEQRLLSEMTLFPAIGNHDRVGRRAKEYTRYFEVPSESSGTERYYRYDIGSAGFIVLDSNLRGSALKKQTKWLIEQLEDLREDRAAHIFVTMHHPLYSIALHGGNRGLRKVWGPIFTRYNVDAVFSGHDHAYMRGEVDGVRYFVSGGGGAPLYPKRKRIRHQDAQAIDVYERVNHYLRISVVGPTVQVVAKDIDGKLLDKATWSTPGHVLPPVKSVSALGASDVPEEPGEVTGAAPWPAAVIAGAVLMLLAAARFASRRAAKV